jgi:ankyrin repeat protein
VRLKNDGMETPLHIATKKNRIDLARELLTFGQTDPNYLKSDVHIADKYGNTGERKFIDPIYLVKEGS